jgi:hypothetical protein
MTLDGELALKTLLAANKRLNKGLLLKETSARLRAGGLARPFFENWQASLKWQRLKVCRHDRPSLGCGSRPIVDRRTRFLGFVEGLKQ